VQEKRGSKEPSSSQEDLLGHGSIKTMTEDGYRWRKYGRKRLKSQHHRNYYKCTHPNCKAKKIIETLVDERGLVLQTQTSNKGTHCHSAPQIMHVNATDQNSFRSSVLSTTLSAPLPRPADPTSVEKPPPPSEGSKASISNATKPPTSTNNNNNPPNINININNPEMDAAQNPTKEKRKFNRTAQDSVPRLVVETDVRMEIDYLDDGYRWRKYGQKNVRGSAHPRSYYKCTFPGCMMRKKVERRANSVINTYEGVHHHSPPILEDSAAYDEVRFFFLFLGPICSILNPHTYILSFQKRQRKKMKLTGL
jgi:hypothetical protein